jgi:hypothetical protein
MRTVELGIGILATGAIGVTLWNSSCGALIHRQRYQGQVRALYDSLHPGMTQAQVRSVMERGAISSLRLIQDANGRWSAEAPYEFGAGNWILHIEFWRDQVSTLRIRTADGMHDHPTEAPPDKGSLP